MLARRACLVAAALAACHPASVNNHLVNRSSTPPKETPSPECIRQATASAQQMVNHFTERPDELWSVVHGKPELGEPATLSEADFIAFLPTRKGREWLCLVNGLCAAVYFGTLNHCEAERADNGDPRSNGSTTGAS